MFDAVRFKSFKCLADVAIELGRMTLLVGANASGKSSVLDGRAACSMGSTCSASSALPPPASRTR
ncbi:hypothetical protein [Sorangium sp. So ce233]|uniref:hypothetical protein n=1 Tax=Sorangium sp. So ce233 TaxID=3133290 RepID=UPI003F64163E